MSSRRSTRRDFLAASARTLAVAGSLPQTIRPTDDPGGGSRLDLASEVARLGSELDLFGHHYLPRLLAPRLLAYREGSARLIEIPGDPDRLRSWRAAVTRLGRMLPADGATWPRGDPEPAEFGDFLVDPAAGDGLPGAGRIDWRLSPLPEPWPEHREDVAREILAGAGFAASDEDSSVEQLRLHRHAVRRWLLALPTDRRLDPGLPSSLLPVLAEADPAFARRAIDTRRLEAAVRADRSLAPGEVARHVGYVRGYFYRSAVSSALARVLAALANNRFGEIGRFLDLPEIYGNWNAFMPRFLFAVLLGKVSVLRDLEWSGWAVKGPGPK